MNGIARRLAFKFIFGEVYIRQIFLLSGEIVCIGELKQIVGSDFIELCKGGDNISWQSAFPPFITLVLSGVHTQILSNFFLSIVPVLTEFSQTVKFFWFISDKSSSPIVVQVYFTTNFEGNEKITQNCVAKNTQVCYKKGLFTFKSKNDTQKSVPERENYLFLSVSSNM